jgi:hypothetical protein
MIKILSTNNIFALFMISQEIKLRIIIMIAIDIIQLI